MKAKNENKFDLFLTLLLGAFAIFSIRSLFQSDSAKIISADGSDYIQDDKNILHLNSKIAENEKEGNQHNVITI